MNTESGFAPISATAAGSSAVTEPAPPTSESRPVDAPDAVGSRPTGDGRSSRADRTRARLRSTGPIVGLVLGIKLLVFAYGVVVLETVNKREFHGLADRLSFWNIWDSSNYLSLAAHGYQTTGRPANYIVFFPGYPTFVRFVSELIPGTMLTAAFVASGIASVTAALLLAKLVRIDTGDDARAQRAVWFLLIFPTAYFLHIPYTEGLFLTFVLGAFVAARSERWLLAGILGALAAFTRINGILLLPALAVEAFVQYRRTGRVRLSWLWIALTGVGLLLYLGINHHVFGDAFHFQDVQQKVWFKHFQNPYASVKALIANFANHDPETRLMLQMELVFLVIAAAAAIAAFRWTRASYGVWAILNVLLFASTSWIQSTPRYAITIFPIFLLLAAIDRQVWLSRLVSAWSLAMMAWFAGLFALGHWAF